MLRSYEAIYDHGHITWLHDAPQAERSRVIITLVSALPLIREPEQRTPSTLIAGKCTTLGDLVDPIVSEKDWECLS
jgi:hypothetical protein